MITRTTAVILEMSSLCVLGLDTVTSVFLAAWPSALGFAMLTFVAYKFVQLDLIEPFVKKD